MRKKKIVEYRFSAVGKGRKDVNAGNWKDIKKGASIEKPLF